MGEQEFTVLTVRIRKDQHLRLWKAKILRGVKIQEFIQNAIDEGLNRLNP